MSLTSWCVAEGVTGGEGNGLLGSRAGAEWVGEIWDTQGGGGEKRREIIHSVWLHIPVHSNQHRSESHTCILIKGCWTALKMKELNVNTVQVSRRGRCSSCSVPTCKGLGAGAGIDTGGTEEGKQNRGSIRIWPLKGSTWRKVKNLSC